MQAVARQMLNFTPFLQLVVTLVVVIDDEPTLKYSIKIIYLFLIFIYFTHWLIHFEMYDFFFFFLKRMLLNIHLPVWNKNKMQAHKIATSFMHMQYYSLLLPLWDQSRIFICRNKIMVLLFVIYLCKYDAHHPATQNPHLSTTARRGYRN